MVLDLLTLLAVAVVINLGMFFVAFKYQTDKLTDISYALTFIVLVVYGLFAHGHNHIKAVAATMVALWAVRLGGFLLYRVHKKGKDSRFDDIRGDFKKFLQFWIMQGISVWVILIPTSMLLSSQHVVFDILGLLGLLIWITGLYIESIADLEKYQFSRSIANKGKWIDSGIWKYSRHPNYFGEILVWVGMYLFVAQSLTTTQVVVAVISPLFIISLLLFVSGIPKLEKSADERWGDDKNYQEYKRRTSLLLLSPKRPAKSK